MSLLRTRRCAGMSVAMSVALIPTGCSSVEETPAAEPSPQRHAHADPASGEREVATAASRVVATYDGGLLVLDGDTLEPVDNVELPGFNRIHPAGDGRHVVVATDEAFRVLDTGAWSEEHGDHSHHFVADPGLTDIEFETDHPGHIVHHAGRTVLFSDGTGRIERFDPDALADSRPESEVRTAEQPHHGVAVSLRGGGLLMSLGNEETGRGVKVLDSTGKEVARSEKCPGVHGAAVAARDHILVGCEDGVLVHHDGRLRKLESPDRYGRIGNQAGIKQSPVVLGDYKVRPDAELERPERVSLIDTRTGRLRLVDLGTSYSFRSLARGPQGEALVLGTDGAIHVIDEHTAKVTTRIPVVDRWREPVDWQLPRPTLYVDGDRAYVTDPATDTLRLVDLAKRKVVESVELPHTPNELTGTA